MPKTEPFLDAVQKQDQDKLAKLLFEGEQNINATDYLNQTPLIIAASLGNTVLSEMLLLFKPGLRIQSYPFGTALTAAIFLKNSELVSILIKAEIDLHGTFDATYHPSAFCWAIRSGDEELVKTFIKHGAQLNSYNEEHYEEHPDWVWGELIDKNCPFKSNPLDQRFDLPLNIAVRNNQIGIASLLVASGANPELLGYAEQNALTLAQYSDNPEEMGKALRTEKKASEPPKAAAQSPIPLELQESFKEIIQDTLETILEMKENNLLELLRHTQNISLDYAVRRVAIIDYASITTMVFLLCCLHPEYWDEPLLANFKKDVLQTGYIEKSSNDAATPEEQQEKEECLKKIAQGHLKNLLAAKSIPLIDTPMVEKTIDKRPADILLRNDPFELACFTPVKALPRDPQYTSNILEAILYKEKHRCRWVDLPRRFPTYSAICHLRRELKNRHIYEPLMKQIKEREEENMKAIKSESQGKSPLGAGRVPFFQAASADDLQQKGSPTTPAITPEKT